MFLFDRESTTLYMIYCLPFKPFITVSDKSPQIIEWNIQMLLRVLLNYFDIYCGMFLQPLQQTSPWMRMYLSSVIWKIYTICVSCTIVSPHSALVAKTVSEYDVYLYQYFSDNTEFQTITRCAASYTLVIEFHFVNFQH